MNILLTREEVEAIRTRARRVLTMDAAAWALGIDEFRALATDALRLVHDLAATPPLVLVAGAGATRDAMREVLADAAKQHKGGVVLLPHGWENRSMPEIVDEAKRVERERCAEIADVLRVGGNPGGVADAIRALK